MKNTIEQGEPVAYIVELSNAATRVLEFELPKHGWEFLGSNAAKITPLYTAPPQPQPMKDALEENERLRDLLEQAQNGLRWYQDAHPEYASPADDELHDAIDRALIEKE